MKTTLMAIVMAALVALGGQTAFAASGKCTVVEVQGNRLLIDCGEQGKDFPAGTMIKIKSEQKKAVEGC